MLAGKDNNGLGVAWGFHGFDLVVVNAFGFGGGFVASFEARFDGADISLNPDEGRIIASGFENSTDFVAIGFGVETAFDDNIFAGFGELL